MMMMPRGAALMFLVMLFSPVVSSTTGNAAFVSPCLMELQRRDLSVKSARGQHRPMRQQQQHGSTDKQQKQQQQQQHDDLELMDMDGQSVSTTAATTMTTTTRRKALVHALLAATSFPTMTTVANAAEQAVNAATAATNDGGGIVSTSEVAKRLHHVPTFTLVDTHGVPYMVVGEDAKVTGYFFTTYGEAGRILDLAKTSSDKARAEYKRELELKRNRKLTNKEIEQEVGVNPWADARISTVPLDFAVTLVTKSGSGGRKGGGIYFQVAPDQEDVQDALALDQSGKDDLPEGRVPLFYFEDFELPSNSETDDTASIKEPVRTPLYFRKSELIREWKKQHPKQDTIPEVRVTELFSVLVEMVKPGGTDDELKTLVFVPPAESVQKAYECLKKGGKEKPFKLGERIVVL